MRIVVLVDDAEWGQASHIQFKTDAGEQDYIQLEGFTLTNELPITQDSVFFVKVYCKNKYGTERELAAIHVQFQPYAPSILFSVSLKPIEYYYSENMIHLFAQWEQGAMLDWRKLKVKEKRLYLLGCLYWSDLPTKPIKSGNYILDGAQVKHKVDFFCLLGEVFFGKGGYFGQCLHGFNDCFCEIYKQNPNKPFVEPNASVTIRNSAQFEKVLNRKFENYFAEFVADLKRYGFVVEFSS